MPVEAGLPPAGLAAANSKPPHEKSSTGAVISAHNPKDWNTHQKGARNAPSKGARNVPIGRASSVHDVPSRALSGTRLSRDPRSQLERQPYVRSTCSTTSGRRLSARPDFAAPDGRGACGSRASCGCGVAAVGRLARRCCPAASLAGSLLSPVRAHDGAQEWTSAWPCSPSSRRARAGGTSCRWPPPSSASGPCGWLLAGSEHRETITRVVDWDGRDESEACRRTASPRWRS